MHIQMKYNDLSFIEIKYNFHVCHLSTHINLTRFLKRCVPITHEYLIFDVTLRISV
jgi:hypothetical protein